MALTDMGKTIFAAVLVTLLHQSLGQFMGQGNYGNGGFGGPAPAFGSDFFGGANYGNGGFGGAPPSYGSDALGYGGGYPSGGLNNGMNGGLGGGGYPGAGAGAGGFGGAPGGAGGVQFPAISCPHLFAYQYDPSYGGWYGQVTTPKTNKFAQEFDVEVNMTVNKQVNQNENIKLQVISGNDEIFNGDQIKWAVKFPFQDVLPKIIQIKFNQAVICTNPGDPLTTGVVQTSMWAKATIKTSNQGAQGGPPGVGGPLPGMMLPGGLPGGMGGMPGMGQPPAYGGSPVGQFNNMGYNPFNPRKADEDAPFPNA